MHFWFEFLDVYMNEQTTCYDYHGFKLQNINIILILINFVYSVTSVAGFSVFYKNDWIWFS
jgi:hypothetical protein